MDHVDRLFMDDFVFRISITIIAFDEENFSIKIQVFKEIRLKKVDDDYHGYTAKHNRPKTFTIKIYASTEKITIID